MQPTDSNRSHHLAWLIGAMALLGLFLLGLDQSFLFDVDEGAFTEATREMLVSQDWGHTTLNGIDRFDKPIGVYWFQAICVAIFGLNEFAFRLPSALSGWLASLALARFAQKEWGGHAAVMAAIISATSLGPWAMARTATADALLGLFFVLIFLDLWRSLENNHAWAGQRVALWVGLGFLVKGPVALVVPVGTLLIYWLFAPAYRLRIKLLILNLRSWLVFAVVALPWYVYAYLRHGRHFIEGFLQKHNVERFMGSMEGHSGHWAYFLIALPLLWLPWSALWLRALGNFKTHWENPFLKYCWIWFLFVFVFFTLANTKLPHYLLYAGPAMCLIVAYSSLHASRLTWTLTWLFALLGMFILIMGPSFLQDHPEWVTDPFYNALLDGAPQTEMKVWLFAMPLIIYAVPVMVFLLRAFKISNIHVTTNFSFITLALYQSIVLSMVTLPWWSRTLQAPVHDLAMMFKEDQRVVVQWGVHLPSFATYRQQESPRREPKPGELALVKNIQPFWPSDWEILAVRGPLAVVKSSEIAKSNP
jgi:4-amino-4-deoxy-L-arabinose transferase-like glycosyltransferase